MPSDVLEFTSNATHMQQVCNKDYDMYRTFSEQSGNVLFFLLNRINRIYKLLYIKVCVYFFGQSHSTRVPHNLFDYCLMLDKAYNSSEAPKEWYENNIVRETGFYNV